MTLRQFLKEMRPRRSHKHNSVMNMSSTPAISVFVAMLMAIGFAIWQRTNSSSTASSLIDRPVITVFSSQSDFFEDDMVATRQWDEMNQALEDDQIVLQPMKCNLKEQRLFVERNCGLDALTRFDNFLRLGTDASTDVTMPLQHLATELWKYCALLHRLKNSDDSAVYVDISNPMLVRLQDLLSTKLSSSPSLAILTDAYAPRTIHGSLLVLRHKHKSIAESMIQLLVESPVDILANNPVLLPRALYALITKSSGSSSFLKTGQNDGSWFLLEQSCHMELHSRGPGGASWADDNSLRLSHHCPSASDCCCSVRDPSIDHVVMLNKHPILPLPSHPPSSTHETRINALPTALPYNPQNLSFVLDDLLYISTIEEEIFMRKKSSSSRQLLASGLFDELLQSDCVPNDECNDCLSKNESNGCEYCAKACGCYCKTLCADRFKRLVSKRLYVSPPQYSRDMNRLIPRIVHQRWHEEPTPKKHPDISRLTQSFRMSGWEYRFYTEKEVSTFLKVHFPPEVAEAYNDLYFDSLRSDFFRYCVLLIYGGLFANVDIMLESNLDRAIAPDTGFIATIDEELESCLLQSFMAASPGHPILAKAVEFVTNRVRNRYVQVDLDAFYCPSPNLTTLRSDKARHTTGSCVLGTAVNMVLNRPLQSTFQAGDHYVNSTHGLTPMPGKIVILHQNSNDMGGKRFTLTSKNMLVAVADVRPTPTEDELANSKDLKMDNENEFGIKENMGGQYDFEALYANAYRTNEDLLVQIKASRTPKMHSVLVSDIG